MDAAALGRGLRSARVQTPQRGVASQAKAQQAKTTGASASTAVLAQRALQRALGHEVPILRGHGVNQRLNDPLLFGGQDLFSFGSSERPGERAS